MRKIFCLVLILAAFWLNAQPVKTLKKFIQLKMPPKTLSTTAAGMDSLPGKRGASVAWHPTQKKYYASFAGNKKFPMAVFDTKGTRLSDDNVTSIQDLRGLWYDPKLKKLCGNGYSDIGWFSYMLDEKGIPYDAEIYISGQNQPDAQSVGAFNEKKEEIYFLYGQFVQVYTINGIPVEDSKIRLYPGIAKKDLIPVDDDGTSMLDAYNYSVVVYTDIPMAEFGLLNTLDKQIELYNRKTGLMTMKLKLPPDTETWPSFNFSYSNGIYWLFNQNTRTWIGYK